jgi:hypothetical protein
VRAQPDRTRRDIERSDGWPFAARHCRPARPCAIDD